uniref:RING-type domain-containing protein n=1 Tax=Parastrongyloides trichosuri TaxID=131310 RepID=A0A0N5A1K0_PARTI
MAITKHELFRCPLCKKNIQPIVCDDFRINGINYERIWWVCEGADDRSCHFPLGLPMEVFNTKRTYEMRDKGLFTMPNFHLLPKEYHKYYTDYFNNEGEFNFLKIHKEDFGELIKLPELYYHINMATGKLEEKDDVNDIEEEPLDDESPLQNETINNLVKCDTDVKVKAVIAFDRDAVQFCDKLKDDTANILKQSRPETVKKLSKRQLDGIKKHIIKQRQKINVGPKGWNEMTLDEQEQYLEEHAFSIHSSLSSASSRASSSRASSIRKFGHFIKINNVSIGSGLSSNSSQRSVNVSMPQSPRVFSPIQEQPNILDETMPKDNKSILPVFDDPVLNSLLQNSYAAAVTVSDEICKKTTEELNIQSNSLDLPMQDTRKEIIYHNIQTVPCNVSSLYSNPYYEYPQEGQVQEQNLYMNQQQYLEIDQQQTTSYMEYSETDQQQSTSFMEHSAVETYQTTEGLNNCQYMELETINYSQPDYETTDNLESNQQFGDLLNLDEIEDRPMNLDEDLFF